jgi:hypothetical protein
MPEQTGIPREAIIWEAPSTTGKVEHIIYEVIPAVK